VLITSRDTTRASSEIPAAEYRPWIYEDGSGRWWITMIGLFNYKTFGPYPTHAVALEKATEFE
jgi:hypothetical protein